MKKLFIAFSLFLLTVQFSTAQEYAKCSEFPLTSISPQGWIQEFLQKQAKGLGGNPSISGYPFNTKMWMEDIRIPEGHPGMEWWPYEQTGYYVDGILRAGYLVNDSLLIKKAEKNINFTLSNVNNEGIIGFNDTDDWSRTVFFRAIMAEYNVTKNPKILDKLTAHFLQKKRLFNEGRGLLSIEQILWLYQQTNDKRLLQLAKNSFNNNLGTNQGGEYGNEKMDKKPSKVLSSLLSDKIPSGHGVSFCEQVKIPAILYMHTGNDEYLKASINGLDKLKKHHMLVDGCPSSVEHLSGKGVAMAHETCDIIDLSWSSGYLLMATRDGKWADIIERSIFNAGLGALDKDFKAHQYYSAPNQPVAADETSQFNIDLNWGGMALGRMSYKTGHDTECCTGNIERMMPVYAGRMWLNDTETGGVVAALYGASTISTTINNKAIQIVEETNYPFSEDIKFTLKLENKVKFPFYLRIPAWCANPKILVNGKQLKKFTIEKGFVKLERNFKNNDIVELNLPMHLKATQWGENNDGVAIERGPLVYSLPVKSKEINFSFIGNSLASEFPNKFMYPQSDWNYALKLDENNLENSIEVSKSENSNYPWYTNNAQTKLKVKAVKVKNWKLEGTKHLSVYPNNIELGSVEETIELVPLGSTYLRMTIFPLVK
ncbi:beta-L-arabinofuranosidase domain-containing protein [Lutibacter citreus]|uniref:beta-L-arabinofuranosidase domain-containing protein n=1 Tax=Lutibacter citreus TaxID=2138210 RepID=UPI000DBE54AE|nr:beta-L-arabinofuranosidase domain-containing protein [Lutibacter citreus]